MSFRTALRLQPLFALPHGRLATLLRGKLPAQDRIALEQRLSDKELNEEPRSHLLFALAHVLDADKDFARAADCLRQANALSLQRACHRRKGYAPNDHERFVDKLLQISDAHFFTRTRGGGSSSRRPVFVLGLPRSGTTLIEQVLASHPQVYGAGELRLARQSFETIPEVTGHGGRPVDGISLLDAAMCERLAAMHLDRLECAGRRSPRPYRR